MMSYPKGNSVNSLIPLLNMME